MPKYGKSPEEISVINKQLAEQRQAKAKNARAATENTNATKCKPTQSTNIDGVKVGDLFYTSWGWEQTNINYYQVVRCTEMSLTLREIAKEYIGGYGWSGDCKPVPDNFTGEQFTTRRAKYGGYHDNSSCHNMLHPTAADTTHNYTTYA